MKAARRTQRYSLSELRAGDRRSFLVGLLAAATSIVPLVIWPGSTSYGEAKTAIALTLIGVLWTVLTLRAVWRTAEPVRMPLPFWGLAGGLVAILVSGVAAAVSGVWWEELIVYAALVSVIPLAATIPRSRVQVRSITWALSAASTGVAVYALLQAFNVAATASSGATISVMGNPNLVGGFLVVAIPATLSLVWFSRSVFGRAIAVAIVAVQLATLSILNHTGGLAALCLALLFIAAGALASGAFRAVFRRRCWAIICLSLLVAGVLAAAYVGPIQSLLPRDEASTASGVTAVWEENSGPVRVTLWRTAMAMFADRPWTGVGLGHYKLEHLDTLASLARDSRTSIVLPSRPVTFAHNDYLQFAAETGVLGVVAAVIIGMLLAVFIVRRLRAADDPQKRMEILFLFGGVVSYGALAAVSFPMHCVSTTWPAVVLLGLAGSPAYGCRGVTSVRIPGKVRFILPTAAAILTVAVGVVAWRGFTGDLLLHRGSVRLNGGFPFAAETALTRSIIVDPNPREAFYYRAIARILQAEQAEADDELARAVELYHAAAEDLRVCETRFPWPDVFLAEANLGIIIGDRAMAEKAVALLVAIRQPQGIYVQALYLQAHLAQQDGWLQDARLTLLKIITVDPDYNRAYVALGDLLVDEGDLAGARLQYEVALSRAQSKLSDAEQQLASFETITPSTARGLQEKASDARAEIRLAMDALARLPEPTP